MTQRKSGVATGSTQSVGTTGHTPRGDVQAFFDRRQIAYDNLDEAALAAEYAPDCVVESPMVGRHQGPAAVQRGFRAVFDAFLDHKITTERLVIDGDHVAQFLTLEGTNIGAFSAFRPAARHSASPACSSSSLRMVRSCTSAASTTSPACWFRLASSRPSPFEDTPL